MSDARIHVVHVLNRLGVGGMENVVVQLVNGLPSDRFRHSVIAITEIEAVVAARIRAADVGLYVLEKKPGQAFWLYPRMYRLLRRLKPDVWHGCNLAALEFSPVACLAGVSRRIHAEHGLELEELRGKQPLYRWLRRLYRGSVQRYVAVSGQIADYLQRCIGIDPARITLIGNGVDLERFRPLSGNDPVPADYPFLKNEHWVVGTVGRQEPIKNPLLMVDAFIELVRAGGPRAAALRLAMIGDGSLHGEIAERMEAAGIADRLWLPGNRDDVPEVLRRFDCFVLPSVSEGMSCTLQEAIASALPVVATDVGGNRAVLDDGRAGALVPGQDKAAMLSALRACLNGTVVVPARQQRAYAERAYNLEATLRSYAELFARRESTAPFGE